METPMMIQLESSTACDAQCVFCPHSQLSRSGEMTDKLFIDIVRQSDDFNVTEILLFLNGEPLVFSRLFDWLALLRKYSKTTTIFTNANTLTLEKAERLIQFSDVVKTVVFSLAGIDEDSYRNIMSLNYNRVRKNVQQFIELNNGAIKIVGHCPKFTLTAEFENQWRQQWSFIGNIAMTSMYNFAGLIHDDLELKEDEDSRHKRRACHRLKHLTILYDGRVCLCCMDAKGQVIFGDANKEPLRNIYSSTLAKKYRRFHAEGRFGELPLCRKCNMNITRSE